VVGDAALTWKKRNKKKQQNEREVNKNPETPSKQFTKRAFIYVYLTFYPFISFRKIFFFFFFFFFFSFPLSFIYPSINRLNHFESPSLRSQQ